MSDSKNVSKTETGRRTFLQQTLGAGLAASAPLIVPASVFGANRPAPSDRLTLASVGVGSQGRYDLDRFLSQNDAQVVAVCDADAPNGLLQPSAASMSTMATATAKHTGIFERSLTGPRSI